MTALIRDTLASSLNQTRNKLLNKYLQVASDVIILAASFILAYLLRFDFDIPERNLGSAAIQIAPVVAIQLLALRFSGVYNFIWRYIGINEARVIAKAVALSVVPLLLLRALLPDPFAEGRIPLSVILGDMLFAFTGLVSARVLWRMRHEQARRRTRAPRAGADRKKPILLVGAGSAGVLASKEIAQRGNTDLDVKGFVDDDPKKRGVVINKIKVLGTTADLPHLVKELEIDHVVICMATAPRKEIQRIMGICESVPVKARIIPALSEILQGRIEVSRFRDVQIEDLLGREPISLDDQITKNFLAGKTVMVTGAGGSIGSELARQVARFRPARLLLVDRAEFGLFNIDRELRGTSEVPLVPLLADVGDQPRMRHVFDVYRPQVIFHAAAHKHVPMMEGNVTEAVKNNVLATHLLGELAGEFRSEAMVLISTDKAVRATSVMGASKRVAELVTQDLNGRFQTRFLAVRFGNVIGSAGSVIPIFRDQIKKGGPVTVTHPDMMRYFMTIPEASQLVLQAGAMGEGGEIFILDMGEPIRIVSLAEQLIALSGYQPYEDINIVFTGVRPGEKLFEELQTMGEKVEKTRHPKIFIGKISGPPTDVLRETLEQLELSAFQGEESRIRRLLQELLPEARLGGGLEAAAGSRSAN